METTQNIAIWFLPRRFDAVVWYVRWQRSFSQFLHEVRINIPVAGPSFIEVRNGFLRSDIEAQLKSSGAWLEKVEDCLWCSHLQCIEPFDHWVQQHTPSFLSTASITWLLSLQRDSWLTLAKTLLTELDTSEFVRSAWATLSLGSADIQLLNMLKDSDFYPLHSQVYAQDLTSGLHWALAFQNKETLDAWANKLHKRPIVAPLWGRLSPLERSIFNQRGVPDFVSSP